nr:dolichol kinase [Hymenolepis microstoma]
MFIQEEFFDHIRLINPNPIKFVRDLISPVNIILVTTLWFPLSILAILVVVLFNAEENPEAKSTFALRKLFHFLAGVVFATGLLMSPHFLSFAAACVLLAFLVVEWNRKRGPSYISKTLNDFLEPFRDSRDSGELIFTPIALILGLSLPIWDFGFEHNGVSPRAWIGVITIALGDSVAALVGRKWGHYFYRWPGTHRTIIGSMVSFVSQMLLWALLAEFYGWSWQVGIFPLGMGVLAEAYTEQIDNLAIPLLVMSLIPSTP